jgi:prepilin signal peptidase PulO-like enzyme (type II secretory pathway)
VDLISYPIYPRIDITGLSIPTMLQMSYAFLFMAFSMVFVWILSTKMKALMLKCNIYLNIFLTMIVSLIMVSVFGVNMISIKGMLLFIVLLYASCSDLTSRTVDDYVFIMILLLACIGYKPENFWSMVLGAVIVFVPQLAAALINPDKALGGADIKVSTAIAFLLGVDKGILAFLIGLTFAIVYKVVEQRVSKIKMIDSFPLIPFLSVGSMIAYMV